MKIAIVGASGFIGSHLIEILKKDPLLELVALSRTYREDHDIEWRRCRLVIKHVD